MPKPEIQIEIIDIKCWNDVFTREFTNLKLLKTTYQRRILWDILPILIVKA